MRVLATLLEVNAVWLQERTLGGKKDKEPRIIIESMRDMDSAGKARREDISHLVDIDTDSVINFEGIPIERVSWVDNSMCVFFPEPTDIAIIDTEEFLEAPFDPLATPLHSIIISELINFVPALRSDSEEPKGNC